MFGFRFLIRTWTFSRNSLHLAYKFDFVFSCGSSLVTRKALITNIGFSSTKQKVQENTAAITEKFNLLLFNCVLY